MSSSMSVGLLDPNLRALFLNISGVAESARIATEILNPPPLRTADEWADENRMLPIGSAEPGRWRTSRTPYMREIYRAASDHRYKFVVAAMGSQMAKTEWLLNVVGHRLCDGPFVPALIVQPTEKAARSFSNDRFQKMIESTPALSERLHPGHADKVTEKFFAGIRCGFGWAGSATELASHPAGLVVVDELDRMESDVAGEGDPVSVVSARTFTYPHAKILVASTPTVDPFSAIWKWFRAGTMYKWAWHCPQCGGRFVPMLSMLKWDSSASEDAIRKDARIECPHCQAMIGDKYREEMNNGGEYVPHMIDDKGDEVETDEPRRTEVASFWVSGLASPWVSLGDSAVMMARAYASRDQEKIQGVINTRFGELYKLHGDAPDWTQVYGLRLPYLPGDVPHGVQLITMGVDVQKRGVYYVIRGWGFNSESWLLRYGFVAGETEYDNVWVALGHVQGELIKTEWQVHRVFVDSGYRPGDKSRRPENQVYAHCRRHHGLVFPTKGHDSQDRPIRPVDIDINVAGRVLKRGVKLFHLDTDYLKQWIYSRIRWPAGEPGGWHVHEETDEDYCRQIVSESLIIKPSGKRVWVKNQSDNHYLDCEVNAYAAAMTLQVHALPQLERKQPETQPQQPPPKQGGFINRPQGGSWFRR